MKNALIAVTALAGLFTQVAADKCLNGLNYCGKNVASSSKCTFH